MNDVIKATDSKSANCQLIRWAAPTQCRGASYWHDLIRRCILTDQQLAGVAACIIVLGHLTLFCYAFVVLIFDLGYLDGVQTLLLVLMAAPLFVLVGHSAFEYVINNTSIVTRTEPASTPAIILVLSVPSVALVALIIVYSLAFFSQLDMTIIGVLLGLIETATGFYLGRIRDHIFSF